VKRDGAATPRFEEGDGHEVGSAVSVGRAAEAVGIDRLTVALEEKPEGLCVPGLDSCPEGCVVTRKA
jgi:hypothetical protein